MAKRTKTLVGLDIDATGIVAASVVVNGRVRIERVAFTPLEPGIIRDGELRFQNSDGSQYAFRPLYSDLDGHYTTPQGQGYQAIFKKSF